MRDTLHSALRRGVHFFFTPELVAGSGSWFYLLIYVPNPLFETLSTTSRVFFDLHKAPAQLHNTPKTQKSSPSRETIFRSPLLIYIIAIMQVRSDSSCFRRSTIAMTV
jgi:hypothetical protein